MTALVSTALLCIIMTPSTLAETTAPVTTLTKSPALPNGKNNWYVTPVSINLSATDLESGVQTINYKIDTGIWQTATFNDTLNLAPNPSFEQGDTSSSIDTLDWDIGATDAQTTYTKDFSNYLTGFETASIKISSTNSTWHSINNSVSYAVSSPYSNMSAEVWVKTESVTASPGVYFKIYSVNQDTAGNITYGLIGQSSALTGTNEWTKISGNFVVNSSTAIGVYIEPGLSGSGTAWFDAVNISQSISTQEANFSVSADGNHTVYYYSTDRAGNTETTRSTTLKVDQTPPGNWHNSGAFRGLLGSNYQLWVYTEVDDPISGISTFTDKYQIRTELHPEFGKYSNILDCGSTWQANNWLFLISPPFLPGVHSAYLLAPKTSFCNSNWNICKTIRFYSEDLAGNTSTKDLCINGPWIKIRGGGIVGSKYGIDMLSEAEGDNTDSVIEAGNTQIDFFTSSHDWKITNNPPTYSVGYNDLIGRVKSYSDMGSSLPMSDGVFRKNGNLTLNDSTIPSNYGSAVFKNIVFVNGNLTIDKNTAVSNSSAVLFVVSGDVKIAKAVTQVTAAIVTDHNFYTAYDIVEGDNTEILNLNGVFAANKFVFQRTLQGTNNNNTPSENFIFEPRFGYKLKDFMGYNAVRWLSTL